jgi:hypothetical protein
MAGRSQLPVQIMENQTRFDLNAAVENWRNELAAQPNLASDDRRELETHLRDAIAAFQQRGLNDEESFWLARRRVGQPQQLVEEFEKADPIKIWRERVFWMVLAYLVILLWTGSVSCIVNVLYNFFHQTALIPWFGGIFYLVFAWLPIVGCAILVAKGKFAFNFQKWFLCFSLSRRLAITAISWSLINNTLPIWLLLEKQEPNISFHANLWQGLLSNILFSTIHILALVVLLIWLMPTQNRKTPKRA